MKSDFIIRIFICNIVVFIINDLSVHFIIVLKFMYPYNLLSNTLYVKLSD